MRKILNSVASNVPNSTKCSIHSKAETFRKSFFSRESIILWTLKTFRKNRRQYEALLRDPAWQHVRFVRLRSPQQTEVFLSDLTQL
jgi:hypothetical protein